MGLLGARARGRSAVIGGLERGVSSEEVQAVGARVLKHEAGWLWQGAREDQMLRVGCKIHSRGC